MNITAFIEARIAEDEAEARKAEAACEDDLWIVTGADNAVGVDYYPERVLRQCAALRKIVESIEELVEDGEAPSLVHATTVWRLAPIAAIWSDHPDYQQEWSE